MPVSQQQHWEYTIREWTNQPLVDLLGKLRDVKVFYDIGANVGGFTRVILERFPDAKAYCFEPVKENIDYLRKNLDVTSYETGIFYGQISSRLLTRGDSNIGGYFVEYFIPEWKAETTERVIQLAELESFVIHKPDLIKIDVEGAEKNIIEHSTTVWDCPQLIIEWHYREPVGNFFSKYLPKHEVVARADTNYLLCLR